MENVERSRIGRAGTGARVVIPQRGSVAKGKMKAMGAILDAGWSFMGRYDRIKRGSKQNHCFRRGVAGSLNAWRRPVVCSLPHVRHNGSNPKNCRDFKVRWRKNNWLPALDFPWMCANLPGTEAPVHFRFFCSHCALAGLTRFGFNTGKHSFCGSIMFAAYKYVITWVLMAEASFCAFQLKLPTPQPITQNDVEYELVMPPTSMWINGAGGRIDAGGYSFSFATKCRYITKLHPFPGDTQAEENELLSHEKSLVDTNGAYLLASNWLEAIQVDVRALEKAHRHRVWQRTDYQLGLLPVFYVEWGEGDIPLVQVVVDGRNKGLVSIRQEDTSFLRRQADLLRNVDKLLDIPDEQFNNYTYSQCTNLVAQYSVVDYYHPFDKKFSITNRNDVTNDYSAILKKYSSGAIARRRFHQNENIKTNSP